VEAKERHAKVAEMLELVDLTALSDRLPDQLSGGQQQRVSESDFYANSYCR